jgi:Fic family protein
MKELNERQLKILEITTSEKEISSSDVFEVLNKKFPLITIKRDLSYLVSIKFLNKKGQGRGTKYTKTNLGNILSPIDPLEYFKTEPDKRSALDRFNFSLFDNFPKKIFLAREHETLEEATNKYRSKLKNITPIIQNKELERFIIELSWKSSKIEGNTYSLLDTEKLLKDGIPAKGHSKDETSMIINHKKAFSFVLDNLKSDIDVKFIEKVHELLVSDLGIKKGFRSGLVGITGTKYKPLDNKYQINEAMESLVRLINSIDDPYTKALVILAGISYIQPFEDGNKRVSRLVSNAILLSRNCAPLSYRNADEDEYKKAMLIFYEKNSLAFIKKIFIEQYLFSSLNYLVK